MNITQFSYDFEMKTQEQNRNNKWQKERFDWFIEQIQMHMAFGWLRKRLLGYPEGASAEERVTEWHL